LIGPPPLGIVRAGRGTGVMRSRTLAALGVALGSLVLLAGCASESKCPKAIIYSDAQLKEVQKAIEKLPKDSILHEVMRDYENERDDLRFCK
jgi:hypothetical protein